MCTLCISPRKMGLVCEHEGSIQKKQFRTLVFFVRLGKLLQARREHLSIIKSVSGA